MDVYYDSSLADLTGRIINTPTLIKKIEGKRLFSDTNNNVSVEYSCVQYYEHLALYSDNTSVIL